MREIARGFTLLEVTIALCLLALALGGAFGTLAARVESGRRKEALAQLEEIRETLHGHAIVHGHLPCPDCREHTGACAKEGFEVNDGVEDGLLEDGAGSSLRAEGPFVACATVSGNLPWVTLAVRERDPWQGRFSYRVTDRFARNVPGQPVAFGLGTRGDIDVKPDVAAAGYVSRELAAIVVSHGGGILPTSDNEEENLDGDELFIDRAYSSAEGNGFDDLLTWISSDALILSIVKSGRLP